MRTGTLITGMAVGGLLGATAAMAVHGDLSPENLRKAGKSIAKGVSARTK